MHDSQYFLGQHFCKLTLSQGKWTIIFPEILSGNVIESETVPSHTYHYEDFCVFQWWLGFDFS